MEYLRLSLSLIDNNTVIAINDEIIDWYLGLTDVVSYMSTINVNNAIIIYSILFMLLSCTHVYSYNKYSPYSNPSIVGI